MHSQRRCNPPRALKPRPWIACAAAADGWSSGARAAADRRPARSSGSVAACRPRCRRSSRSSPLRGKDLFLQPLSKREPQTSRPSHDISTVTTPYTPLTREPSTTSAKVQHATPTPDVHQQNLRAHADTQEHQNTPSGPPRVSLLFSFRFTWIRGKKSCHKSLLHSGIVSIQRAEKRRVNSYMQKLCCVMLFSLGGGGESGKKKGGKPYVCVLLVGCLCWCSLGGCALGASVVACSVACPVVVGVSVAPLAPPVFPGFRSLPALPVFALCYLSW